MKGGEAAEQAAVEAVRAELAALAAPPVPPEYAARWAAALAAESNARVALGSPRVVHPPTRPGWRRVRPAPVVLAALALVVAVVALWPRMPEVDRIGLVSAGLSAVGSTDAGPLADPARRAGCLRAVGAPGVDPDAALLGGRMVVVDGRPGVLLVLPSGVRGSFRVLVVDRGCGPAGGTLLSIATAGGR